jgi:hypothetical protein
MSDLDTIGAAIDRLQHAAAGMATLAALPGLRRAVGGADPLELDAGLAVLAAAASQVLDAAKAVSVLVRPIPPP